MGGIWWTLSRLVGAKRETCDRNERFMRQALRETVVPIAVGVTAVVCAPVTAAGGVATAVTIVGDVIATGGLLGTTVAGATFVGGAASGKGAASVIYPQHED